MNEQLVDMWDEIEISTGSDTHHGFGHAIKDLQYYQKEYRRMVCELQTENERLRDEHFKDRELAQMQENLQKAQADLSRGFKITEAEEEMVEEWKRQHLATKHPQTKKNPFCFGAIGGNFHYEFIPTSIGTIGTVKCSACGAEYTFRDLR